jgi:hypothetical protein
MMGSSKPIPRLSSAGSAVFIRDIQPVRLEPMSALALGASGLGHNIVQKFE